MPPEPRTSTVLQRGRRALADKSRAALRHGHGLARRVTEWLTQLPSRSVRQLTLVLPTTKGHWLSAVVLWVVFLTFAINWGIEHERILFDPGLQNDDAQTSLFGFHAFAKNGALRNDPFAAEMRSFMPLAVQGLYFVLIRLSDLYVASKLAQGLAILVLLSGGIYLACHRRAGLAAGLLMVFLCLYTFFIKHRIDGGLARAFAFPALMWWIAGALVDSLGPRWFGAILSAAFYPPCLGLVLAAEGLFSLRGLALANRSLIVGRLGRYAALVAVCSIIVAPAVIGLGPDRGPIHTLEQAKKEPAFYRRGRLKVLPLKDPTKRYGEFLAGPYYRYGKPFTKLIENYKDYGKAIALVIFTGFLLLVLTRLSPAPVPFMAILCGSAALYLLSVVLAFQLYSPSRYSEYGASAASVALAVSSVGLLLYRSKRAKRAIARNLVAASFMAFMLTFVGDGNTWTDCCIERKDHAKLWDFIRTLPRKAKFAGHLNDVDGIPYWGARSTTGGYETMQPWFVGDWKRQQKRVKDTLRAMYAFEPSTLFDFCDKYKVTHLLVKPRRYRNDFRKKARSFKPITTFTDKLLKSRQRDELVLAHVPAEAIVFRTRKELVVDVEKLRRALSHAERR